MVMKQLQAPINKKSVVEHKGAMVGIKIACSQPRHGGAVL